MSPASLVLSRSAVRELDRLTVERYGIPSIVLMENAARSCAEAARAMLPTTSPVLASPPASVLVVCGTGNNGGDGLAIARHLHNDGREVRIVLTGEPMTADARTNLVVVERMGLPLVRGAGGAVLDRELDRRPALVIDALLGTGLTRPVEEPLRSLIEGVNAARAAGGPRVLAIDLPSGLDVDTGHPLGVAIRADRTVTLAALKPGLLTPHAAAHVGMLTVGDIGVPRELIAELAC